MLQYDKLYQSLKKVSGDWHAGHVEWYFVYDYLKFYPNGTFAQRSFRGDNFDQIRDDDFQGINVTKGSFNVEGFRLDLILPDVKVLAYINIDRTIIIEGKICWDLYRPI